MILFRENQNKENGIYIGMKRVSAAVKICPSVSADSLVCSQNCRKFKCEYL